MPEPQVARHALLAIALLALAIAVLALPPLPQPAAYHLMADGRAWLRIQNGLNVLSNAPLAIAGLVGLAVTARRRGGPQFAVGWERWPYVALFGAVTLTAFGSAYYHLKPDNARLFWDRLPMAVGFMALVSALVAERVSLPLARRLFGPLITAGAASVVYWYWTEVEGRGDLRFYLLVQLGSLAAMLSIVALYPARYAGTRYLMAGIAAYGAAKVFELGDTQVFAAGRIVSGHTLKHLAAAAAVACLVRMLVRRSQG